MSLEEDIKEYALDIGFDRVGFTSAEPFHRLGQELDERNEMYSWISKNLLQLRKVVDPANVLPAGKSVIVLLWDYYKKAIPPEFQGKVGKAYLARPYSKDRILPAMIKLFRSFLEKEGMTVKMRPTMPDRQAAARAGIGFFGRNTFIYAPGIGSYVAIVSMVVDRELEGETFELEDRCTDKCQKCLEACPTGALYEPFRMNPLRCVSFHTYGTGNFPMVPADIPRETRKKMGSWFYGCDVCQDVCPYNSQKQKLNLPPDAFLEEMASKFTLPRLLLMDDEFYTRKVQPFFFGYIWDKKFLQRNAAIVLGNTGDTTAVPHLQEALENQEEIVREHAAWALGQIGGAKSRRALELHRESETSFKVREEINMALEED